MTWPDGLVDVFVVPIGQRPGGRGCDAIAWCRDLVDMAYGDRGLKGSMKAADRSGRRSLSSSEMMRCNRRALKSRTWPTAQETVTLESLVADVGARLPQKGTL